LVPKFGKHGLFYSVVQAENNKNPNNYFRMDIKVVIGVLGHFLLKS
jgi:hypothetical protein